MDLNNNGGPQRGTIMEPPTPADCKNQPLTSFLYTFFQGGLSGMRRAARLSYCTSLAAFPRADVGPRGTEAENANMCRGKMAEIIQLTASA